MEAGQTQAWQSQRREYSLLGVCIVLLLLATIPPLINLGRYQHRVASAISRSIGRPIALGSVSLRLLPWPAFRIENLVVAEDPGFGAEPALVAPEVIATPRFTSLWRGRFEVANVEFSDASVNLVRSVDGRWNLGLILQQASHLNNAPTGQRHAGAALRFPYIEATNTRINVKQGAEKMPYSLLNADFSMWLERPDVWGLKLAGNPVRTDSVLRVEDTGTLHLDGELHRASELGTMPVALRASWSDAPLGELSQLLLGRDLGWRGDLTTTAQLTGAIDDLHVQTHVTIENLHREEFTPQEPFRVDATCHGHYSRAIPANDAMRCQWPLGDGGLTLSHLAGQPAGALTLEAKDVPAHLVAAALALARRGAPAADRFHGEASGTLDWVPAQSFAGTLTMPTLQLDGAGADGTAVSLQNVTATASFTGHPSLAVAADPLAMGVANAPMMLGAELTPHQVTLHASGSASLAALQAAVHALRGPRLPLAAGEDAAKATARVAVSATAPWMLDDAQPPQISGTLHFENVSWSPHWIPLPVTLPIVDAAMDATEIRWSTPGATIGAAGESQLKVSGSVMTPLACEGPACASQFALATPSLRLGALPGPRADELHVFAGLIKRWNGEQIALPAFSGTVRADLLTAGDLPVHNATLVLAHGPADGESVRLESGDGALLGGTLHGTGTVTLPIEGAAKFALDVSVTNASAAQAAALWHENWGPGTLSGTARFTATGMNAPDLAASVAGTFHLSWQNGALKGVLPHFADWDGSGTMGQDGLHIVQSNVSGTPETLSGVVGWDRTLHLAVEPGNGSPEVVVSGSLQTPQTAAQ